ncbi:copper resistance CopC/CopD family protein [Ureibacillus sp. MALMAid1270]|uniref:copper resistance CopC/CopD family protein n=1 Tax=Ureibacillus sp. MALMAid1270 TaxID=3411629 RepID=UPI003BA5314B
MKKIPVAFFLSLVFFLLTSQTVWSHASVVKQSPMPNSQHETSPEEVKIRFNSEVEENFSLKVFNDLDQEVDFYSPTISEDRMEISVQLPTLEDGVYTIDYYIISSNDGHVVQGNYHILVGTKTDETVGPGLGNSSSNDKFNALELIIYLLKSMYYFGLVLLIGWIIWWQTVQEYSVDIKRKYILWGFVFQMIHLLGLISVILIQMDIFTSNGLFFTPNFPFDTDFGFYWLTSLVLSLVGFLVLFKNRWIDISWLAILVFCKSLNGHASAFDFTYLSATFNSIHLIAAGLWAGGLTFMVIYWRKHKLYVKEFMPIFSHHAFISFILMAITGTFVTLIYSPSLLLLESNWGRFLMIKLILVILVVAIAMIIRFKLKKSTTNVDHWIKIDFSLMLLIVITVSVLTFLSPTP